MPWVAVDKEYEFEGPNGKVSLGRQVRRERWKHAIRTLHQQNGRLRRIYAAKVVPQRVVGDFSQGTRKFHTCGIQPTLGGSRRGVVRAAIDRFTPDPSLR